MAPYKLSDLAVREIKIPRSDLVPVKVKSYTGNFLLAHILDFWALFWITALSIGFFKGSLRTFLNTEKLRSAWDFVDLSFPTLLVWGTFALSYFFFSFYFNHGQTWGMKTTGCRISLKHHHASGAIRWALFSVSLFLTLGLSYKFGSASRSDAEKITCHDHLWHDLVAPKQLKAPDLKSLLAEEKERDFPQAA